MNQTNTPKRVWTSQSIEQKNLEWLKTQAALLTDQTGVAHSINDVITVLRQKDIELTK